MRAVFTVATTLIIWTACKGAEKPNPEAVPPPPTPSKVGTVDSLQTPESVKWDSVQDVYFVANINGNPAAKDNNGFISRVRPDGSIESLRFIEGGKPGVALNAPKGMALSGDTLWVTDIDAVRAFDKKTGVPVMSVDLRRQGAIFLNDVAVGPDGALYVTDTAIGFDEQGNMTHPGMDRIFRIGERHRVSVAAEGDTLQRPNGITWDEVGKRFIVAPFGGPSVFAWKQGNVAPTVIARGPAGFDGVEMVQGRLLVSSWTDSTVSAYESGSQVRVISGVASPADFGYDAKRNRILIPLFTANRMEIWQLP
ncbi:MAG: SMP-30/gluconolactonase/LRE family protein [Gemmatimonadales bacterium]